MRLSSCQNATLLIKKTECNTYSKYFIFIPVLTLNRALFDLIDHKSKQITDNKEQRNKIFQYHLVRRTGGKRYKTDLHPNIQDFDKDGEWKDILKRQYTFQTDKKLDKNTYLMVKTIDDPKHEILTVDAVNMDLDNWVFGCKANSVHKSVIICESGINLSNLSEILPSNGKRKSITLDLVKIRKEFTHIIVYMAKGMSHIRVSLDVYNAKDRVVEAKLPKWISFWYQSRLVKLTMKDALFYNLSLSELDQPWQAYEVSASVLQCSNKKENVSRIHYGLMKMKNAWALDQSYSLLGSNASNSIVAKLLTPKTSQITDSRSEVHLYLDPDCRYALSVRPDLSEMFAQVVRYYYPMILPMSLSIVLMIMANQFRILEYEGKIHPCHQILWSQVSPISSVMPARLLTSLLGYLNFPIINDFQMLNERGIDFGVLPIMMYFISIGFVLILTLSAYMKIIIYGNVMQKFVTKFINSQIPVTGVVTEVVTDSVISGLTKFPIILSFLLIILGTSTCGTLSLCLGTLFQFLKLFKMYKKYLDWLLKKSIGIEDQISTFEFDQFNFQLSLGLLWTLTTVLNVPSLLAWSHDLSFTAWPLTLDHSYLTSVIFCLSIPVLWSESCPNKFKTRYSRLSYGLQFCSILIVLFGIISLYRINYILSCAMIMLGAHQITSSIDPTKSFFEEIQDNEDKKEKQE